MSQQDFLSLTTWAWQVRPGYLMFVLLLILFYNSSTYWNFITHKWHLYSFSGGKIHKWKQKTKMGWLRQTSLFFLSLWPQKGRKKGSNEYSKSKSCRWKERKRPEGSAREKGRCWLGEQAKMKEWKEKIFLFNEQKSEAVIIHFIVSYPIFSSFTCRRSRKWQQRKLTWQQIPDGSWCPWRRPASNMKWHPLDITSTTQLRDWRANLTPLSSQTLTDDTFPFSFLWEDDFWLASYIFCFVFGERAWL